MIARLRGTLVEASYTEALVECAGVGYSVNIPLCTFEKLPLPGNEVILQTLLIVREDDMSLYGFATKKELQIFRLLNTVNGIGAKTAQRVILELKDKMSLEDAFEKKLEHTQTPVMSSNNQVKNDAVLALTALGYSSTESLKAVSKVEITSDMDVEAVLKAALKHMSFF